MKQAHFFIFGGIARYLWQKVFGLLSKMFDGSTPEDPAVALLNLKPDTLTKSQFKLLMHLTTAAKQTIAKAWKSPCLVLPETIGRMNKTMIHSKMLAIETNKIRKFETQWHPWIRHCLPPDFQEELLLPS